MSFVRTGFGYPDVRKVTSYIYGLADIEEHVEERPDPLAFLGEGI